MKSIILALCSGLLVAAAPSYGGSQSSDGSYSSAPAEFSSQGSDHFNITADEANILVEKYVSILQQKPYQGTPPKVTAQEIVTADYQDSSDSVDSLLKKPIKGSLLDSSRTQWLEGIAYANSESSPPYNNLQTTNVLRADGDVIVWTWTLPDVGDGEYPVSGIQLLYFNCDKQIYKAYFEFNSLAWGANTGQVREYCSS
ncbi:hypothetical protein EJ03DRAFT_114569 [Teratosphaeria nubilosa]|uniref:NTF2-like domain-containing protein n=1 Tax=Teratosphaeria nubilosa TaxID=161662 RepID=A0A6G1L7D0_9PEZI|nr:hypothetical protein EJ03DRAFT_114569 [Teratosphaeria nubilosa]